MSDLPDGITRVAPPLKGPVLFDQKWLEASDPPDPMWAAERSGHLMSMNLGRCGLLALCRCRIRSYRPPGVPVTGPPDVPVLWSPGVNTYFGLPQVVHGP